MTILNEDKDAVLIGSGYLYAVEAADFDISDVDTDDMSEIGYIKDSATFKRTHESKDIESANYGVVDTFNSKYTTTFDTGIISYNAANVAKFLTGDDFVAGTPSTANGITTTTKTTYFTEASKSPAVALVFVVEDEETGSEIKLIMPKCRWQGEYTLDFNNDNPIETNYSFKCFNTTLPNSKIGAAWLVETTKTAAST